MDDALTQVDDVLRQMREDGDLLTSELEQPHDDGIKVSGQR